MVVADPALHEPGPPSPLRGPGSAAVARYSRRMAAEHLERLTALDASFLHQESSTAHMHVGALTIFEGPPMAPEELADHLRGRLHLVPRYRQKLSMPPLQTGRPLWVDDPAFDLEDHVFTAELPAPGDDDQL